MLMPADINTALLIAHCCMFRHIQMEGSDTVLGHYSVRGDLLQPLLSGSSSLFKAVVEDDLSNVAALGTTLDTEVSRFYNVLHWTSADDHANLDSSLPTTQGTQMAPGVAVKARTILMLAAYHSAQSGRLQVLRFLLGLKSADPRQRSPDGVNAFEMAKHAVGDAEAEVLAMLQAAADNMQALPASQTASLTNSASSGRMDPLMFPLLPPGATTSAGEHRDLSGFSEATTCMDPASSASDQGSTVSASGGFLTSVDLTHHLSLHTQDVEVDGIPFSSDGLSYQTSELTQPEFSTDEFRMFAFKVLRCSKRFAHDWRSCPFAHPTENARRRDPREFRYCAIACPDYKQGFCVRGDLCSYAHGVFEAWLHPSRYRTQLCKDGANCHRPICFFAHSLPELRTPTHTWTPSADDAVVADVQPAPSVGTHPEQLGGARQQGGKLNARPIRVTPEGRVGMYDAPMPQNTNKNVDGSLVAGLVAGAAAAAVSESAAPGSVAAMFGFTAPRMSNAFARRHGLNPRDNAMLNLQKIALQAQQGSGHTSSQQQQQKQQHQAPPPTHMGYHTQAVAPHVHHNVIQQEYVQQQPNVSVYTMGVRSLGMSGISPGVHGKATLAANQYSGIQLGQVGNSMMLQQGYSYATPSGLMSMQAVTSAPDPSLAALNHHLASLTLHPTAAAAAAAYAAGQAGMGGYHDGHGM